ncbi:MAG: hypothetical protein ACI3YT_07085, partial [Prevotella sp.]
DMRRKKDNNIQNNTAEKPKRGRPRKNPIQATEKPQADNSLESVQSAATKQLNDILEDVTITREENRQGFIDLLAKIEEGLAQGRISFKDAVALERDIRARLNDKFDMQKSDKERRIIVVPQKHLFICKYTNRECSNMPPKEVCMKYYNLVEKDNK